MKKIYLVLILSLLSLGFYRHINIPVEQVCRGEEKSTIIFGDYDTVLDYAKMFDLKISRIKKINDTTYRLYYWLTTCYNV
jgi:hypothetical protein